MNKKQIILNDRDMRLMRFINKYRVASIKSASLVCEFNSIQYTGRRMKKLVEYDYIAQQMMYYRYPPFYKLTTKGQREIGIVGRAYKPSYTTALHYIGVGDIAAFLAHKYGIDAIQEMYIDKDLRHNKEIVDKYQLETSHKPDIIFRHDGKSYFVEYERSRKGKNKTMENILMNHLSGVNQIWVVGEIRFEDIKRTCNEQPHYQRRVTFMDYTEIVKALNVLGGVKVE